MTVTDQFAAWRQALDAGKPVEYTKGSPTAGYYKRKRYVSATDRTVVYDAVGIWRDEHGWICVVSGGYLPADDKDAIEELFVNINKNPITYELFDAVFNRHEAWPEAVKPVEIDKELPPHKAVATELKTQGDAYDTWLVSLGHKPQTQEEADRAANFAAEFGRIETKAKLLFKVEKQPNIDAGKEIDARWKSTIDNADMAKTRAKQLSKDFADAENARRKKEADEENARQQKEYDEAQKALAAKGVRAPEMAAIAPPKPVIAEPVKLGTTGRRQSMRKIPTFEITDATALLSFLANRNIKSQGLLDAALSDAKMLHKAGIDVPGFKVGSREEMV